MDGSTAVWLGLTLAAPLTLVPEIALLRLLHSRRAAWHPLDVLIVSLLVGQLCCTLVTLGLSATALAETAGLLSGRGTPRLVEGESTSPFVALELLHHRTPLCAALISFWAAAHTLHAATLTSMAVDRAMTIRWPYKYRVSVRRTQIRYHVVVLAVVSLLVGVATLFASTSGIGASSSASSLSFLATPRPLPTTTVTATTLPPAFHNDTMTDSAVIAEAAVMAMEANYCSFLPYTFDSRFALFWLCLHGVLFLTTLTAGAIVFVTRIMIRCSNGFSGRLGLAGGSGSDMRTLGNASDGSSATLPLPTTTSSSSSALPTLPAPPPPRYTPGPVACLSGQQHGTAKVSPTPQLTRSSHPNFMFGSTDKNFMNLLHHHESGGMLADHHKTGTADFCAATVGGGCCGGGSWNRQRHSTVAAVLIVAYLTHHLPLLVLTTLGTFFVDILPAGWPFSALILGLSLFSGLLFMAVLVFIDPVLYAWMVDSLRPASRRIGGDRHRHLNHQRSPVTSESATLEQNLAPMKIDDDTRYRMSQIYSQEPTEAKFPLTNGSLFVHLMNPSSGDGKRANRRPSRMGVSAYDHRPQLSHEELVASSNAVMAAQQPHVAQVVYPEAIKPPLMTFMSRARILSMTSTIDSFKSQSNADGNSSSSRQQQQMEPFYNDPLSIGAPPSFADVQEQIADAPVHHAPITTLSKFKSHEPIYASLSETLSSCHTLDSVEGPAALDELREMREMDEEEEEDEGSATESAGDDFEFHNIRTSRQTLITPQVNAASPAPAAPEVVFGLEDLRPRSRVARSATYRVLCNGLDVKCASKHDKNDPVENAVLAATSESQHGIVTCVTIQIGQKEQTAFGGSSSSLRRSKLLTSLSMNDIDVLGQSQEDELGGRLDCSDGISQFDAPMRSDSLFSLYVDEPSSQESSLSSPFKETNQSLMCSAIELSNQLANYESPARRSPLRQQQQQHPPPMVNLRKKSSHRSRAAVLKRFQQREMSWPGQVNGSHQSGAPLKTGSVVSIAALKAALTQSPTSHYLDNGDVYYPQRQQVHKQQQQQQSKTVFVSDYI
ncbi:LOW QUALITY PROTEIN: uncharacterized protein LOC130694609 [Daphnia carinata]|uniref:LOW QUALITY PROTEIN: uncharacterized protein LOC130694609 n=1 Tax=Daphnia carinata TaxID=120202 RepID=UPI00257EED0E|nr:LOW QUALITY PROTEIN: uncharacterized protein LOC130694609 [Daphnia carinata]